MTSYYTLGGITTPGIGTLTMPGASWNHQPASGAGDGGMSAQPSASHGHASQSGDRRAMDMSSATRATGASIKAMLYWGFFSVIAITVMGTLITNTQFGEIKQSLKTRQAETAQGPIYQAPAQGESGDALIAEISGMLDSSANIALGLALVTIIAGAMIASYIGRTLSAQIERLSNIMYAIAEGNYHTQVKPSGKVGTELARMYNAVQFFKEACIAERDRAEEVEAQRQRTQELNAQLEETAETERRQREQQEQLRQEQEELRKEADTLNTQLQQSMAEEQEARREQETLYEQQQRLYEEQARREQEALALNDKLKAIARELDEQLAAIFDQMREDRSASLEAVTEMENLSGRLKQAIDRSADATDEVSTSMSRMNTAVQTLLEKMETLARTSTDSKKLSDQAIDKMETSNTRIRSLEELARSVDEIIELIQDIAFKTRLLAFNATIESARAGESGKGFAVVANEVKKLATQTESATHEISQKIASITKEVDVTVDSMQGVSEVIHRLSSFSVETAENADAQAESTRDVSRLIDHISHKTHEMDSSIKALNQDADSATELSEDINRLAQDSSAYLEQVSAKLKDTVSTLHHAS